MKILKYMDLFGIHFHFYIGNKRKLYTSYGGIISLICLFFCTLIFFILAIKELSHKNPISNMSSVSQAGYHKVKFGEEKIWIPWRIIDFNRKFADFKNKIYPIIHIKKGEKKDKDDIFKFDVQKINYKLCNETDFAERGKSYFIDAPLNELYCIEFENLELGGGWTANFLYYIQLDIFLCKDGIEYNETNPNCTKFELLKGNNTENDILGFEYFYPNVEFQPINYENPILVIYKNHYYNFSSYLDKNERLYVQEYVLNDDKGLIFNDDKNFSFWGYISSDFDILYSNEVLLNGKKSSKLYSLSLFLDAGRILYMRRYNKIYTIIANIFPIFNVIFFIFNSLTYMIKIIMTEKYLSELFFQRIKEHDKINIDTKDKRKSAGFFYNKYKMSLNLSKGDIMFKNNFFTNRRRRDEYDDEDNKNIHNKMSFNSSENNNENEEEEEDNNIEEENHIEGESNLKEKIKEINKNKHLGKIDEVDKSEEKKDKKFGSNDNINKSINFSLSEKRLKNEKSKFHILNNSKNSSNDAKTNKSNLEKFNNKLKNLVTNKKESNNNYNNSSFCPFNSPKVNNYMEINLKKGSKSERYKKITNRKRKIEKKYKSYNNDNLTNFELNNRNMTKTGCEEKNDTNEISHYSHFNFYKNKGLNYSAIITRFRLKGSLFKMRDYIYSFFIKAIRKDYKCISKEFGVIFNFLSDVYDISSYLQLYKQFHILSGFLLDNVANIDLNHRININNKELFEQIALKNKNIFYFALKEQFNQISNQ